MKNEVFFPISEKMQRVREIQLDLLCKFSQVCAKNGLSYFLDGGTLLGAIRHEGFIPWDDDIDVIMPRRDYDKLCEIAEHEFEYPYFFQTAMTEKCFFRAHAQLRNSKTTGFILLDQDKEINRGIFIDIFILDGIADSRIQRVFQRIETTLFGKLLSFASDRPYAELSCIKKIVYKLMHFSCRIVPFKTQFNYYNKHVLARYSYKETSMVGDLTLGWRENVQWKKIWYSDYVLMDFENMKLRVPINYDEILKKQYGDYMKIPQNIHDANGRMHDKIVFEPDIPYADYFNAK